MFDLVKIALINFVGGIVIIMTTLTPHPDISTPSQVRTKPVIESPTPSPIDAIGTIQMTPNQILNDLITPSPSPTEQPLISIPSPSPLPSDQTTIPSPTPSPSSLPPEPSSAPSPSPAITPSPSPSPRSDDSSGEKGGDSRGSDSSSSSKR